MVIATDFKFGVLIAYIGLNFYPQCKCRPQRSKTRSRGYILNLPTAVNIYKTAKAIGFKFSTYFVRSTQYDIQK